jgi:hypothetical protein
MRLIYKQRRSTYAYNQKFLEQYLNEQKSCAWFKCNAIRKFSGPSPVLILYCTVIKSILYVQTGSRAHPASCTMGTGGPFPGGKVRPGRDADHSPLSSAEVVNE